MYPYGSQQIITVNGEASARAYRLPPNSSALLLDSNDALVWLVQSDGAGYTNATPYTITKYEPPKQPDINDLLEKVTRLERLLYEKSDTECNEQPETESNNGFFGSGKRKS